MTLQNKIPVVVYALTAASPPRCCVHLLIRCSIMLYDRGRVYIVDLDATQCDSVTYRHTPLSSLGISVTEAEDDEEERRMARSTVATSPLFRESLYSNYFQPAGDSSCFMRQLTNQHTRFRLVRSDSLTRYALGELKGLEKRSKKETRRQAGKLSGGDENFFNTLP